MKYYGKVFLLKLNVTVQITELWKSKLFPICRSIGKFHKQLQLVLCFHSLYTNIFYGCCWFAFVKHLIFEVALRYECVLSFLYFFFCFANVFVFSPLLLPPVKSNGALLKMGSTKVVGVFGFTLSTMKTRRANFVSPILFVVKAMGRQTELIMKMINTVATHCWNIIWRSTYLLVGLDISS